MFAIASISPATGASADRFARLQAQDLRVASVAYRLSTADRALCVQALTPQLGFALHGLEQYALADRAGAARSFGLGNMVGVMAVVAGSPAQHAGLVAGDQLVSVNGRILPNDAPADAPSRANVDRAQAMLIGEMQRGAVTINVSGATGPRVVRLTAERGCPAAVEVIPGAAMNAWADGSRILIGGALLSQCASDADLALIIGHEMAHNLLHHRQRLAALGITANALLPVGGAQSAHIRETEEEADRLAVRLVGMARYDLSGVEEFLGGLLGPHQVATTHPDPTRRLALLRAAISAQRADSIEAGIGNTASSGLVSGRM